MSVNEKFKRRIEVETHAGLPSLITVRFADSIYTEFIVREYSSGLNIEHMYTFPGTRRGEGYGTEALKALTQFAKNRGHKTICARSVLAEAERFWTRAGFKKEYGHTFIRAIT